MALQKQLVSFPFSGLAEKSGPLLLQPGEMIRVENGFFQRSGEIRKRYGFSQIYSAASSRAQLTAADGTLYTATASSVGSGVAGLRHTVKVDRLPAGSKQSTYAATSLDMVDIARHSSGWIAVMGLLSRQGVVVYSETDGSTNTGLAVAPSGGTVRMGRLVATQNYICWLTSNSAGALGIGRTTIVTGTNNTTASAIATLETTTGLFDAVQAQGYTDNILVAYRRAAGSGGGIGVARINSAGAVQASAADASETIDRCLGWITHDQADGYAYLATCSSASGVRWRRVNLATCAIDSLTTTDAAATNCNNVTGVRVSGTNTLVYDHDNTIYRSTKIGSGSQSLNSMIASRAFYDATSGKAYVWLTNSATVNQGMLALCEVDPLATLIVGRALYAQHPATVPQGCAPSVVSMGNGVYSAASLIVAEGKPESTIRSNRACRVTLDLSPTGIGAPRAFGGMVAIPGFGRDFSVSDDILPSPVSIAPEAPFAAGIGTAGSLTSGASYLYRMTYDVIDDSGRTWRSAPSDPLTVALGASEDQVTLTIYNTPFQALAFGARVFYTLWRSAADGTELRMLTRGEFTSGLASVNYVDSAADTAIDGNEMLYTSIGGELPNYPGRCWRAVEAWKTRLFGISSEDPTVVCYTKQLRDGYAPEWVGAQCFQVADEEGEFASIAEMDDKLILFKRSAVYVLTGDGPDLAGNGLYQAPERLTVRAGCVNPVAIVKFPLGLMYSSPKGIYMLTRGLESTYVGAAVESTWQGLTITGAVCVDDQNQVRFMSSEGTTLVYDWVLGTWTTYTGQPALHCCIWQNKVTWISSVDGSIQQETPGAWSDNGSAITTSITTGWLSFAQVQSFKRVKCARLFGVRQSAHSLIYRVAYDQVDSDVVYPTVADLGAGVPYQPDIWLGRQKLGSLRVKISDSLSAPGEGARWQGLAFEVALKPGKVARTSG